MKVKLKILITVLTTIWCFALAQTYVMEWQSADGLYFAFPIFGLFPTDTYIDMNNDGQSDLILTNDTDSIYVYDIVNNELIWSYQATESIFGFANLTDEPTNELILGYEDESIGVETLTIVNTNTNESTIILSGSIDSFGAPIILHNENSGKDKLVIWVNGRIEIWGDGSGLNIVSTNNKLPNHFTLEQNYPNPFNPLTTIDYEIKSPGNVKILVYNLNGQLVETLDNKYQTIGYYSLKWNANGLSSGQYFYRIEINGKLSDTKKAILLK